MIDCKVFNIFGHYYARSLFVFCSKCFFFSKLKPNVSGESVADERKVGLIFTCVILASLYLPPYSFLTNICRCFISFHSSAITKQQITLDMSKYELLILPPGNFSLHTGWPKIFFLKEHGTVYSIFRFIILL